MLQPLNALCSAKKYHILSVDTLNGVTLNYNGKIVTIPYTQWKNIESFILSYFDFALQKTINKTFS